MTKIVTPSRLFFSILAVILFISLYILSAKNPLIALFQEVKYLEYIFLALYMIYSKPKLKNLLLPLICALVFQSFLAILQWTSQSSLNGIFYWFGERSFTPSTPAIALIDLFGTLKLRAYGTFSHPNVLGGFLSFTLTITAFYLSRRFISHEKKSLVPSIIFVAAYILGLLALITTFSLSAIFSHLLGLILISLLVFRKRVTSQRRLFIILIFLLLLSISSVLLFLTKFHSPNAIEDQYKRMELNKIALHMFIDRPLIGAGLSNFIPNLAGYKTSILGNYWWQPAHNIYLLILSEEGIVGLIIMLWLLIKIFLIYKQTPSYSPKIIGFILLSQLLFIGLFDHYFLTLQQGQLMTVFIISLAFLPQTSYTT